MIKNNWVKSLLRRRTPEAQTNDAKRAERGFTLVETAAVLAVSIFLLYALHTTLTSSVKSREVSDRMHRTSVLTAEYLERIRGLPFGRNTDPAPAGSQMTELFDDDQEFGTITLHQLKVLPTEQGHTFQTTSGTGSVSGTWRIKVSTDLDGNGTVDGPREGRDDIFRVEIYFNNQLQRETLIAADPAFTKEDSGANYKPVGI